jgi:hypothetical protein
MGLPIMSEAVKAFRHVSASTELQNMERMRSKAGHDEAQALQHARRQRDEHWQGVVEEKDAMIAKLIAKLEGQKPPRLL